MNNNNRNSNIAIENKLQKQPNSKKINNRQQKILRIRIRVHYVRCASLSLSPLSIAIASGGRLSVARLVSELAE